MIPRFRPPVDSGVIFKVVQAARPDAVRRYESAFAETVGMRHAIAFPYGRTAIRCFLESHGVSSREVICPAYSCVVVAHAVMASGNRPCFIDSTPDDPNMDLDAALAAVTDETGALIPTSLFGRPVDLDQIGAFRSRHPEVPVLQDCCHSFAIGTGDGSVQAAGDAAVFALNFSKITTSVFGGMLTTDDTSQAEKFRQWRDRNGRRSGWAKALRRRAYTLAGVPVFWPGAYGVTDRLIRSGILDRFVRYFDPATIEMPPDHLEELTNFEAEVGLRSLSQVDGRIGMRRAAARIYLEVFGDDLGIDPGDPSVATFSHFILRHEDPERFIREGRRRGVEYGRIVDYSIPDLASYRDLGHAALPNASKHAASMVNVPVAVSEREARRIAAVTRDVLAALGTMR